MNVDAIIRQLDSPVARLALVVVVLLFIVRKILGALSSGGKGNFRKQIRKEIRTAIKIGNYQNAGMLMEQLEEYDEAISLYKKHGLYGDAARLLLKRDKLEQARKLLTDNSLWKDLGELLKDRDPRGSAAAFRKAGDHLRAAEVLEKANLTHEAADDYRKAGLETMASVALKTSKTLSVKQAKELETDLRKQLTGHIPGSPFPADTVTTVKRICKVYMQNNLHQQGVDLALKFDLFRLAAQIASEGKVKPTAALAEACAQGGEHEAAAGIYDRLGEKQAAALQRATGADKRGELIEAARWYAEAGEELQAGEIYVQLQQPEKAAENFEKAGDFARAAELWASLGEWKRAAMDFEKLSYYREAAHAWQQAGDVTRQAAVLEKAGRPLEAARIHFQQGRVDKAISLAQQVTEDSPDFRDSRTLLAELFVSKGDHAMGIRSLERSLQGVKVSRETSGSYYMLATLLEKAGEFRKAADIFEQIVAEAYDYKDVKDRLLRVQRQAEASPQPSGGQRVAASQEASVRLSDVAPSGAGTAASGPIPPDGRTQLDIQAVNRSTGRYRLEKEVGAGGMGVVYRAFDTVLNRAVAYKMMPTDLKSHPEAAKFFIDEARATAQLSHPNIVHVYDCGEDERGYFIVMEFIEGEAFDKVLRKKKISVPGVINIAQQVAGALSHAHSRKLIHRDLKPSNLLWTTEKKVMLLDFGLARAMNELGKVRTRISGTPYYMAPEQVRGGELDARCDLYSFGAVLFELFCNRPPFTEGDIGYHHNHTMPPDPRLHRSDLTPVMAWIVLKLLAKKPEDRFQSADELLQALKSLRDGSTPPGYVEPPAPG